MHRVMLAMLAWIAFASSGYAQAETRLALVVGNEAYSGALTKLNRPYDDADNISGALRTGSFSVIQRKDQNRTDLLKEVRALADRLKQAGPDAVGFFYYSGHGASALVGDRRRNYMIPVGTAIETPDDLVAEGIPLDDIIAILQRSKAKAIFVVFDACRSELPWSKGGADPDKAFNAVAAGPGMFIAYSTAEGTSSPDDGAFASALAAQLVLPGRTHLTAFDAASRSVGKMRGSDRRPWYSNQIDDDIYFAPRPALPNATPGPTASLPIGTVSALLNKSPATPIGTVSALLDKSPAAFAAAQSGRPVAERTFRDRLNDGTEAPELVALPTGSFTMGSPVSEAGRRADEGPTRTVTIGTQIAVMKYEVTVAEYRRFFDATGRAIVSDCYVDAHGDGQWAQPANAAWIFPGFIQSGGQPVVCVSWDDAKAYAAWLSQQTGETYRLLSEAEWEYAARSGQQTPYSFGADAAAGCRYMNGADATAKSRYTGWDTSSCNDGYLNTSPVGAFAANAFGLFDMSGNAAEWVEDCYEDSYAAGQPSDGRAFTKNDCSDRVVRSGSWINDPENLRSAGRDSLDPALRYFILGFRLARTL